VYQGVHHQQRRAQSSAVLLLVVSRRGHHRVNAQSMCCGHGAAVPMNSGLAGRWDRDRTCALRLWSQLPFVQGRSGTYTSSLEMAHFDRPKYQEVHQSSPALGSTLGSMRSNRTLYFRLDAAGGRASRTEVESRLTDPELASPGHIGRLV
jgi:hypothetical protein